jgi:hypothetical protein
LGTENTPGYGLAQPAAELTLTTKKDNQGKTYTVDVGTDKDVENNYVVKSSESTYYCLTTIRITHWRQLEMPTESGVELS